MICKTCSITKSPIDFYISNKSRCKKCSCASVTKHRIENIDRVRAYDKLRSSMPHRVAARNQYQKTPAGIFSHIAANERWALNHPKRRNASIAVGNAVRHGKLLKTLCHICGDVKVEGHHPDYDRPLDVVWLCTTHHKQTHSLLKTF